MNPAVWVYRVGNWFHRRGLRRIAWIISWMNRFWFGTWIPSSAKIGRSVVIGYWGLGVVIHKDAVIGDGCHISHNVTIGRNPGSPGVPVIGNGVYIAAGAVVSGNIVIGDRAVIGANSVVLSDVPVLSLAAGAPARIVRTLTDDEHARIIHG